MIRYFLIELALFLTPFLLYGLFLWATQADMTASANWPRHRVIWLAVTALLLMIGSFILLAEWGGAPPGSTYVPAHMENGRFIPGATK